MFRWFRCVSPIFSVGERDKEGENHCRYTLATGWELGSGNHCIQNIEGHKESTVSGPLLFKYLWQMVVLII